VPTAAFLYDVAGFSAKWLRDVAADQWEDGTIANISPCPPAEGAGSPVSFLNGSAGGGDAIVIVPWEVYRAYGDVQLLADLWPNMVRWLDRTQRLASAGRHPARTGAPLPHERYLWDTGFHWGEWLEPGDDMSGPFEEFAGRDKSDVATAYYARSAQLMSRIAARALTFGLLPGELRERVAARIARLVRDAGTHLGTGFLATPDLLPALAEAGYADLAYGLLLQDTPPSWLAMTGKGGTTVWESWRGIDDDGVPHESLNHYSKGAVISFLHRYTAGIRLGDEPAYRAFRVQPVPGGGLTSAAAAHESPYGRIESSWTVERGLLSLDVTVPPGTTAEVILPGRPARRAGPGRHSFQGPARAQAVLPRAGARHDRDRLARHVGDDRGDPRVGRVPADQAGGVDRPQQARQARRGGPAHHAERGEPVVRRQVVGPDPLGEVDGEQLAQAGGQVGERPALAHQQPGLDLRERVLRLGEHGGQEGRDDHVGRVEARPQDGHDLVNVPVLLELHVEVDPPGAGPQHLGEQRRPDPGGRLDLVAGEAAHRRAAGHGVVKSDQLAVAGPADVELDHVGPDVDRVRKGRDGVLGGPGRDPSVRGDHGTDHEPKYYLVRLCTGYAGANARLRLRCEKQLLSSRTVSRFPSSRRHLAGGTRR
jgi:hypothetical protein